METWQQTLAQKVKNPSPIQFLINPLYYTNNLLTTQRNLYLESLEHTGHSKYPLSTTQEKTLHMDITRWSIPKSDYILCSQRWRSSIESEKTRLGADYGSDYEFLIAKFRLILKKVG